MAKKKTQIKKQAGDKYLPITVDGKQIKVLFKKFGSSVTTKNKADKIAKQKREEGYLARVFEINPNTFHILIRSKSAKVGSARSRKKEQERIKRLTKESPKFYALQEQQRIKRGREALANNLDFIVKSLEQLLISPSTSRFPNQTTLKQLKLDTIQDFKPKLTILQNNIFNLKKDIEQYALKIRQADLPKIEEPKILTPKEEREKLQREVEKLRKELI